MSCSSSVRTCRSLRTVRTKRGVCSQACERALEGIFDGLAALGGEGPFAKRHLDELLFQQAL